MRTFIRVFMIFCLAQLCVLAGLTLLASPADNYRAAVIDKERLLDRAASPRVVLVGGSGLAFGVDSPTLEQALGRDARVVNMGLHAGLGLEFMMNETLQSLRSGDTVVLSPEYDVLWSDSVQPVDMAEVIRFAPTAVAFVEPRHRAALIRAMVLEQPPVALHDIAVTALRRVAPAFRASGAYYRSSFNANGDDVAARNLPRTYAPAESVETRVDQAEYRRNLVAVKRFAATARSRGVSVYYMPAPIDAQRYAANHQLVEQTVADIELDSGVRAIGTAAAETYPLDSFYDTGDHLRGDAVFERSRRIAAGLRAAESDSTP